MMDDVLRADAYNYAINVKFAHTYSGDCFYTLQDLMDAYVEGWKTANGAENRELNSASETIADGVHTALSIRDQYIKAAHAKAKTREQVFDEAYAMAVKSYDERIQWLLEDINTLSIRNGETEAKLEAAEDDARVYKREWESAIERCDYKDERIKELEAEVDRVVQNNIELREQYKADVSSLKKHNDYLSKKAGQCDRYKTALIEVDKMLIDGTVVCKRCGDEETLQDSDMRYVTIKALDITGGKT